jgi:hypothetical protein
MFVVWLRNSHLLLFKESFYVFFFVWLLSNVAGRSCDIHFGTAV